MSSENRKRSTDGAAARSAGAGGGAATQGAGAAGGRGKRPYRQAVRAERQAETRRRIAAAAAGLHAEVGPARTTVAEIARRAGVQRPTVYSNFPDERELFAACQAHFLTEHPPPDLAPLVGERRPLRRLELVLEAMYGWYRATRAMAANVQRDRRLLPELDALLTQTADAQLDALADVLAERASRALVRLALDFATWQRLDQEGLGDPEAARLMAAAASRAA
jgi:AcrR family transcriptional regulator